MAMYDSDNSGSSEEDQLEDIHEEALEQFEQSQEVWEENQRRYEQDVKFARMGEQWDDNDAERRRQDGRPMLTVNRLPSFIRQVSNDARQNKPQIKVMPQDSSGDPNTAEVLNGLIKNIENISKADLAYDTAIDCAASGGMGYFRVDVDYSDEDTFDMDIRINRILNPLTVYPDANSTAADSSDWNYCFITEMMPLDEFEVAYPDADPIDFNAGSYTDREALWFEDKSVRLAEYWCRKQEEYDIHQLDTGDVVTDEMLDEMQDTLDAMGIQVVKTRKSTKSVVKRYVLNGQEILETDEWEGSFIPVIPVYGEEVYHEGERHFYSLIHFAKDAQRMYNYWRTTTTELVALAPKAPWIGPAGSFDTDLQNWQVANTETLPFLEYDGDVPPQRQPFAGPPAGALQEALNASDDMKSVMGLHDASMGAQSNEISGVAISKRVREGDTSTFHFIDNMSRAIRHAGIVILDLIPHIYSQDRILRIIGQDEQPQTVRVNAPFQSKEEMLPDHAKDQMEAINSVYDLRVGKYDVVVKAGPSYTTQREEARNSMIALLQAFPQAAQVTGDLVVESMDWPNADAFAKRLKAILPPGVIDEAQDPQAAALANQVKEMDAVIQQLMAGREAKMAEIQVDREKLGIDSANAETNRLKAETERLKAEVDAEYKRQQLELDAAKVMQQDPVDDTPVVIKQMELSHDQAKVEIDSALEERKLSIEEAKVSIDQQRLDIERFKAEADASVMVSEAMAPEIDISIVDLANGKDLE
jgi:hypothetical protein